MPIEKWDIEFDTVKHLQTFFNVWTISALQFL